MTENNALIEVEQGLAQLNTKLTAVLPPNIPSKQFCRIAVMAIEKNPELLNCDRQSVYSECLKCAADGLVLDDREATLQIFKGKAKYMPMYMGLLKLVRNTGMLSSIAVHIVHENESFEHIKGPVEEVIHKSVPLNQELGDPIGAWACAVLKSGERQWCVMSKEEIMRHREVARSKNVWDGPFGLEQWKKTVLRRICKLLPQSSNLNRAFESDNEHYDLSPPQEPMKINEPATEETTRAAKVVVGNDKDDIF